MNILLVIRSEIIAIFMLVFFIIYDKVCAKYREGKDYFQGFAYTSLGHSVMALVTEITVNIEGFPVFWNNAFHILFFVFALLFSLKYFEYVQALILPKKESKIFLVLAYVVSGISIVIMLFSPIEYLQGNGTKYSAGLGPSTCYILGYFLMMASDVLIIIYRKKINLHTVVLLIPVSICTLLIMLVQIFIPEFLFSGCALSITTVGVFFAIENPIEKFQNRAFIDAGTQMWNQNCYEYDMVNVYSKLKSDTSFVYVLMDINGLKIVNDHYGHLEGDNLIKISADILTNGMEKAHRVYRMGGDEFAAIYLNTPLNSVESEVETVQQSCQKKSKNHEYAVSIAIGYAAREAQEPITDVVKKADRLMYEAKNNYYKESKLERRRL